MECVYFCFFLTITNPMTILSFIGIFAGLGFSNSQSNIISSSLLVLGVFLGSAFWWLLLSFVVSLVKERIEYKMLSVINRISGLIILLFGIASLTSSLQ
nr:LysE family transporter [Rummeliibacillus sp. TYF005]